MIDLGTARAADTPARFEKKSNADSNRSLFADSTAGRSRGTATTLMSGQRIHFNGTPAYATRAPSTSTSYPKPGTLNP